jgi:hypothetical protein
MTPDIHNRGPVYVASFAAHAMTTNPFDAVGILASTLSRVAVCEFRIGHQSSAPVSQTLGIQFLRGSTASSTSAAITPRHIHGWSGVPTAGSSVTLPCTTLASTTSAVLVQAGAWHLDDSEWVWRPDPRDRLILDVSQRLHIRLTAPSTALPVYGCLTFGELGKPAG